MVVYGGVLVYGVWCMVHGGVLAYGVWCMVHGGVLPADTRLLHPPGTVAGPHKKLTPLPPIHTMEKSLVLLHREYTILNGAVRSSRFFHEQAPGPPSRLLHLQQ